MGPDRGFCLNGQFGMAKDRFGCHWIVNGQLIDMRLAA
jgi:hypothetical protein